MQLRYFAWLREKIGHGSETLDLPAGITTPAGLIDFLAARGPNYALAFANPGIIRCAIDQEFAGPGDSLAHANEVAFFPPVTGG